MAFKQGIKISLAKKQEDYGIISRQTYLLPLFDDYALVNKRSIYLGGGTGSF